METKKLKVGQRVWWYEAPGQVVTVPVKEFEEYGVKLDSGEIIFDMRENLITPKDLKENTDNGRI